MLALKTKLIILHNTNHSITIRDFISQNLSFNFTIFCGYLMIDFNEKNVVLCIIKYL